MIGGQSGLLFENAQFDHITRDELDQQTKSSVEIMSTIDWVETRLLASVTTSLEYSITEDVDQNQKGSKGYSFMDGLRSDDIVDQYNRLGQIVGQIMSDPTGGDSYSPELVGERMMRSARASLDFDDVFSDFVHQLCEFKDVESVAQIIHLFSLDDPSRKDLIRIGSCEQYIPVVLLDVPIGDRARRLFESKNWTIKTPSSD